MVVSRLGRSAYGLRGLLAKAAVCVALASPALAQTVTVAALGDSLTQGYGLAREEGFVPRLQEWLVARGRDVAIVNAGVSGDTTAGGLSRVDWTLTPDIDAMIVALGGNDLLRGIDPAVSRANLDAILSAADAAGVPVLLVGLSAPGNYGPDYKAAFDAIYPELAARHDALLAPDFLGAITGSGTMADALGRYMQADGIHPNAAGVELIVEDLGPAVEDLVDRAH